jgi:hypothetical protein
MQCFSLTLNVNDAYIGDTEETVTQDNGSVRVPEHYDVED